MVVQRRTNLMNHLLTVVLKKIMPLYHQFATHSWLHVLFNPNAFLTHTQLVLDLKADLHDCN